jgi:hypothetical protein
MMSFVFFIAIIQETRYRFSLDNRYGPFVARVVLSAKVQNKKRLMLRQGCGTASADICKTIYFFTVTDTVAAI